MNEDLLYLIKEFKEDRRLLSFDEAATKQAVILRILSALGWNPFDIEEVHPEYSVGGKRVDYALRHNGRNKVFIEVKKVSEDLEKHQEQLLSYSFQEGVKLAVLTNGISWWFYLPLREGSWEQRKFYTIEIYDQDTEEIVTKFEEFLSKDSVITDKAIENAENLYKSKQKQYMIEETLPKAWKKIITEPDETLIEILAETTEKLCGYKPDVATVEKFLMTLPKEIISEPHKNEIQNKLKESYIKISNAQDTQEYTGKRIVSFAFKGIRYPVRSWKDLLIKISILMLSAHRKEFERVLSLRGRKRPYFSKNPNELRSPERLDNTDIFVETNLNANRIIYISKSIITLFGYADEDLSIETK